MVNSTGHFRIILTAIDYSYNLYQLLKATCRLNLNEPVEHFYYFIKPAITTTATSGIKKYKERAPATSSIKELNGWIEK